MKILFSDIICEVSLLEVFKTCQRLVHPSWDCKFMLPVLEILISLCVCSSTFSHSRSLLFPRPALAASEGPGLRYTYDKSK